jgi:hypothetical protein
MTKGLSFISLRDGSHGTGGVVESNCHVLKVPQQVVSGLESSWERVKKFRKTAAHMIATFLVFPSSSAVVPVVKAQIFVAPTQLD